MRRSILAVVLVALIATSVPAFAELQNVIVGGSLRIRGNWYSGSSVGSAANIANPLFGGTAGQGPWAYSYRDAGGNPLAGLRYSAQPGRGPAVFSLFGWDDANHKNAFVEQRTRLNVRADFTDAVSAFIEFDSYDVWGEDFRSNYITGVDGRAFTGNDVEVFQAYVEANEMFGYPVRVRVGRQELLLGSGWLVGPMDTAAGFTGTSFDAIRATYATDMFSVDAFWAKLADNSPLEEDGDIDLYGVYGSYLGIENISLDAYWMLVRDARRQTSTPNDGWFGGWVEDLFGVDDYDPTMLHTIGLRGAGTYGAFDFEVEGAYQFGNADVYGIQYAGFGANAYGEEDNDFDMWAANAVLGYTFDMTFTPRVFVAGAYFAGEDERDVTFMDWLGAQFCPFWTAEPSISFNRLFSSWEYSEFLENSDLSNFWTAKAGVSVMPTESLKVTLTGAYFAAVEAYEHTWPLYWVLGQRVQWFNNASFIGEESDKELGWEAEIIATYSYSEDLTFEVGYSHFFVGDGLADGNFVNRNAQAFNGGTADDDADYVYFETKIAF